MRRAKQSRPVAPGHVEPVAGSERRAAPPPEEMGGAAVSPAEVEPVEPVTEPVGPADLPTADAAFAEDLAPESGRDGAWLPAGITVLVMVSLLVCAGLVLIAAGKT